MAAFDQLPSSLRWLLASAPFVVLATDVLAAVRSTRPLGDIERLIRLVEGRHIAAEAARWSKRAIHGPSSPHVLAGATAMWTQRIEL